MIKNKLLILVFVLFVVVIPVSADTHNAVSCTKSDVYDAYNLTTDEDTLFIPSGDCDASNKWTSYIKIEKEITIQGNGTENTIIGINNANAGFRIYADNVNITEITFDGNNIDTSQAGVIIVGEHKVRPLYEFKNWRIYNNTFRGFGSLTTWVIGYNAITTRGHVYGVIDHNLFIDCNGECIDICADTIDGMNRTNDFGQYTSSGVIFIEDNNFTFSITTHNYENTVDSNSAARITFRHNYIDVCNGCRFGSGIYSTHETCATCTGDAGTIGDVGTLVSEIYDNIINLHSTGEMDSIAIIRGGTALVYNNSIIGSSTDDYAGAILSNYRSYDYSECGAAAHGRGYSEWCHDYEAGYTSEGTSFDKTTLNGALGNDTGCPTMTSVTDFPTYGGSIMVDSEQIDYTAISGNTLTPCTRGIHNTTRTTHIDGSNVDLFIFGANLEQPNNVWVWNNTKNTVSVSQLDRALPHLDFTKYDIKSYSQRPQNWQYNNNGTIYPYTQYPYPHPLTLEGTPVAPTIISWSNNYTDTESISFEVPVNTSILFNVTADQTITNWYWSNANYIDGNGTAESTASKTITEDTVISIYGTNTNGTSNTITWTITIPSLIRTIGKGGLAWNENSVGDNTTLNRDTGHILLTQEVSDWLLYAPFDNTTGTIAYNENLTSDINGVLNSGASWTSYELGNAVLLDGVTGNISFSTPAINGDLTLSLRIRPENVSTGQYISDFGGQDEFALEMGYEVGYTNIYGGAYATGNSADTRILLTGVNESDVITWVKEGTNLKGYLNKELKVNVTISQGDFTPSAGFQIGNQYNWNQEKYKGIVDDTRLYTRAITHDEVNQTVDNIMVPTGIRTVYNDAATGYENYFWSMNSTIPANTNMSVIAYDNDTLAFVQQWTGITSEYTSGTLTGTKPQDIRYNITLNGNTTATSEIINFTFYKQAISETSGESGTIEAGDTLHADLDNGAFINVPGEFTFTNLSITSGQLQFWLNDSRLQWRTNTNKTLTNIKFIASEDNFTFNANGTDGYLNFSGLMNNASSSYSFYLDTVFQSYVNSDSNKIITVNYTGAWSDHTFTVIPTVGVLPNITAWYNSINGWNQTAMSINAGNSATFNITSDQAVNNVSWKVAGSEEQNTSSLEFTRAFNTIGEYNVTAQAFNSNGNSNIVYTVVTVTSTGGGGTDWDYAYGWVKYSNGTAVDNATITTSEGSTNSGVTGYYSFGYVFEHGLDYNFNVTKTGHTWHNQTITFTTGDYEVVNATIDLIPANPAPIIASWGNDNTSNNTLTLTVDKNTNITFNATANQTITTWTWTGATEINGSGSVNTYAYKNFTAAGVHNVSVYGTNDNGTTQTVTWTVTVSGAANLTLSGYVSNSLEVYLENARVDFNSQHDLTDTSGYYEFTNVTEGNYTVLGRAIGYVNKTETVSITADTELNLTLSERKPVTVSAPGFGAISGLFILAVTIIFINRRTKRE